MKASVVAAAAASGSDAVARAVTGEGALVPMGVWFGRGKGGGGLGLVISLATDM